MISYNYVVMFMVPQDPETSQMWPMLEELSIIYFTVAIMCSDQCYTVKTLCVQTMLCHFKLYTVRFTQISSCKILKAGSVRIQLEMRLISICTQCFFDDLNKIYNPLPMQECCSYLLVIIVQWCFPGNRLYLESLQERVTGVQLNV